MSVDAAPGTADPAPSPTGQCVVAVLSWSHNPPMPNPPTVRDPERHLRYRSFCDGCGHAGPIRSGEGEAVEDGHDHAFPGWRGMPVLVHCPYNIDSSSKKKIAKWEADARRAYPEGWFERGGPVLEWRGSAGTRHVPGRAPGGGYAMAVVRPDRPDRPGAGRRPAEQPVQTSLFG
ncbi:hypothetical protein F5972_08510 [Microbispora cellulosiformans]|uniref:Uncharacterized protein n=1 Tax=Microbispora cellulosiformans TaxID=2614688 RepID=A0A5J5K7L4_9ACTN|nr:DUF6349 family protein [Microbispora cellulosiformans]KAA9379684.1 hypothetical protein F5972_08510 [Microbispora cellulosiformans]